MEKAERRVLLASERAGRGRIHVGHQNISHLDEVRDILVGGSNISAVEQRGGASHASRLEANSLLDAKESPLKVLGPLETRWVAAFGNHDCAFTVRVDGSGLYLVQRTQGSDAFAHLSEERAVVLQLS